MQRAWAASMQGYLQAHAGVVSIGKLTEFGATERDGYRLASTSDFELIMPGVLRSTHWPLGQAQLQHAACLRNPRAVVAELSAAREWRFRSLPKDDSTFILVPHGSSPEMPGVVVRRCRLIDPVDIVELDDGRRVTSPPRTLFDCADRLGVAVTASNLELLINEDHGTFATHAATLSRLGASRRPGSRTMAAVIASRPAWRAAMQSSLETKVFDEIRRQGLPVAEVQFRIVLPNGQHVRLDFAWPEHKVALEVDHPFWHDGWGEGRRDKRRDLKMATLGWQTVRISNVEVAEALASTIRDVALVLAAR